MITTMMMTPSSGWGGNSNTISDYKADSGTEELLHQVDGAEHAEAAMEAEAAIEAEAPTVVVTVNLPNPRNAGVAERLGATLPSTPSRNDSRHTNDFEAAFGSNIQISV